MKTITDAAIAAALRTVKAGTKASITLTDAAPRGAPKLLLIVRPGRAEWYSRRMTGEVKSHRKLGRYPQLSLADARRENLSTADRPRPDRSATLGDMLDGYVARLRAEEKPSANQVERVLEIAGAKLGRHRPAAEITPAEIVELIRPIFERGARVQADKYRMYLSAAYRWAMRATHDYRVQHSRNWGLAANPVDAVPRDTDAEGVGDRWLSEAEFRDLFRAVTTTFSGVERTRVRQAVALLMLTGQRVREIIWLKAGQWDSEARLLTWAKTKNGKAHVLPVGPTAARILDGLKPCQAGYLFPSEKTGQPIPDGTVLMYLRRFCELRAAKPFTGRDLRRTWKTLAGEAGLTKDERDWLQNHTEGKDVSSKHYDRYAYLREKRAAVVKWESWLAQIRVVRAA